MDFKSKLKEKILYKTEDVRDELDISPWRIVKALAGVAGAAMSSYVVGSVLRANMPEQPSKFKILQTAVGIYLLQGVASTAVSNYVNETLSEYDFIFGDDEQHEMIIIDDDGTERLVTVDAR